MPTKTTKRFILVTSIIFVSMIALNVYLVIIDFMRSNIRVLMFLLTWYYIPYLVFFIISVRNRLKKNPDEKKLQGDYILYYEVLRDKIRYSYLTLKEKKSLIKKALGDVTSAQQNESQIDCDRYIDTEFKTLGYRWKPIFFILNGLIFGIIILLLNQVKNIYFMKDIDTFFESYYPTYHTIFLFLLVFLGVGLYRYYLSRGKVVMAFVPFPAIFVLFAASYTILLEIDRYSVLSVLYGDTIFTDSVFKLVMYIGIVVALFGAKYMIRRWQVKKVSLVLEEK